MLHGLVVCIVTEFRPGKRGVENNMGMRSWSECGIGFPLFDGNALTVFDFIMNHKDSYFKAINNDDSAASVFQNLVEIQDEATIVGDDGNEFIDESIIYEGLNELFDYCTANAIAMIINYENECLGFGGFPDDGAGYTVETIMYVPSFPWQMTEKESKLTSPEVYEILTKYAKELGVSTSSIEEQELEYYG